MVSFGKNYSGETMDRNRRRYTLFAVPITLICALSYFLISYINENKTWTEKHNFLDRKLRQAAQKNVIYQKKLQQFQSKVSSLEDSNYDKLNEIEKLKISLKSVRNDVTANNKKYLMSHQFYTQIKVLVLQNNSRHAFSLAIIYIYIIIIINPGLATSVNALSHPPLYIQLLNNTDWWWYVYSIHV